MFGFNFSHYLLLSYLAIRANQIAPQNSALNYQHQIYITWEWKKYVFQKKVFMDQNIFFLECP